MSNESNSVVLLAAQARDRLATKVVAFVDAYVFVLESSLVIRKELLELASKADGKMPIEIPYKSMMGAMFRLTDLLQKTGTEFEEYFRAILFVDLISSTESYFSDLVRAVIKNYPMKAARIQFELQDIIEAADVDELVARAADIFIHRLMYEKPEDYLEKICAVLSIKPDPIEKFWPSFVEAKARRDLGVHNNWICNQTYIRKTGSLGLNLSVKEGEKLSPKNREYCESVTAAIFAISNAFHEQIVEKYS